MDPLGTSKWNLKVRIWISHQIPSGRVQGSPYLDFAVMDVGKLKINCYVHQFFR
jgi:hypothetical protein